MSILTLYGLFVLLPNLGGLAAGFAAFVLTFAFVIATIAYVGLKCGVEYSGDEDGKRAMSVVRPYYHFLGWAALVVVLLNIIAPSEKQIYTVAGGYAATNDAELKKLPDNVLHVANDYLEKLQQNVEKEKPHTAQK